MAVSAEASDKAAFLIALAVVAGVMTLAVACGLGLSRRQQLTIRLGISSFRRVAPQEKVMPVLLQASGRTRLMGKNGNGCNSPLPDIEVLSCDSVVPLVPVESNCHGTSWGDGSSSDQCRTSMQ